MTTRERWIVYPLLFLALGASLRDKVIPPVRDGNAKLHFKAEQVTAERIVCSQMQLLGQDGKAVAVLGVDSTTHVSLLEIGRLGCRELRVKGPSGKTAVMIGTENKTHSGMIETLTAEESPLVQLRSTESGGLVSVIGANERIGLMGLTPQDFGLFLQLPLPKKEGAAPKGGVIPVIAWPGSFIHKEKGPSTPSVPEATQSQQKGQSKKP